MIRSRLLPCVLRVVIATGIAALFAADVWAQRYNFKFYGEDEGLKNLAVQAVLQDRAGFLWAGTDGGLARRVEDRFQRVELRSSRGTLAGSLIGRQGISSDRSGRLI